MINRYSAALAICLFSTSGFAQSKEAPAITRVTSPTRYALVIGSNVGDANTAPLTWARADADKVANLLVSVGGVEASNVINLYDPSQRDVDDAVETLSNKMLVADAELSEFVLYYSGHANASGLMLGEEVWRYDDLRATVDALPARVGVTILDACATGNIERSKGGSHIPALQSNLNHDVQGRVYLSSTSRLELAQESDKIGGSIFTHYLTSGMRGAADASGDGDITLDELYQFTFQETLRRTQNSALGPQHPRYDLALVGYGEFVLASLDPQRASMTFSREMAGRFFIWSKSGELVAEFNKNDGSTRSINVEPGEHTVFARSGSQISKWSATVRAGEELDVDGNMFVSAEHEEFTRARGSWGANQGFQTSAVMSALETLDRRDRVTRKAIGGTSIAVGASALIGTGVWLARADPEHKGYIAPLVVASTLPIGLGAFLMKNDSIQEQQIAALRLGAITNDAEATAYIRQRAKVARGSRVVMAVSSFLIAGMTLSTSAFVLARSGDDPDVRSTGLQGLGGGLFFAGLGALSLRSSLEERVAATLDQPTGPNKAHTSHIEWTPTLTIDPARKQTHVGLGFRW